MNTLPPVPLTLEGSCALHQMFRFRWRAWCELPDWHRDRIVQHTVRLMSPLETGSSIGHANQSAIYSQLGHKADLLIVHFRDTFEELNQIETLLARSELADFLEPVYSYVSVVELGLYESSAKTYTQLNEAGKEPHTADWNEGVREVVDRQSAAMASRLYPTIPDLKYICFYPMDRKRGEQQNWYSVPMAERQRMMHDHGMIGRRYADSVKQIITGSIGFDDWEWGVTLFGDDPLAFKKLIYEMRFDEVSAIYALFGSFYLGIRVPVHSLPRFLTAEIG